MQKPSCYVYFGEQTTVKGVSFVEDLFFFSLFLWVGAEIFFVSLYFSYFLEYNHGIYAFIFLN